LSLRLQMTDEKNCQEFIQQKLCNYAILTLV